MDVRAAIGVSILASIILSATAWKIYRSPSFGRPLGGDEAISLEYYTWAGIDSDGEPHRLRRMEDYYRRPSPGLRLAGLGLYCSLGRWNEPNNHVVNSLMMDLSQAIAGRDEKSARLPALGFALLFGVLFLFLCRVYLGSAACALPVMVCALWSPYLVHYSQEARGYSAMLALQSASILVAVRVARNPDSIAWGFFCAVLCLASLLNVVSLAVDWVLPFYLSLFLASWWRGSRSPSIFGADPTALRRNLLIQGLAIGTSGFFFLMSHLPAIVSSTGRYGLKLDSLTHLPMLVEQAFRELFPSTAWMAFAVAGLVGLLCGLGSDRGRFLALLTLASAGISLAHFLTIRRFPYTRTLGYFLPFLFLGVANLVRLTIELARTGFRRCVTWAAWTCLSAWLIAPSLTLNHLDRDRMMLIQSAKADVLPSGALVYSLMGDGLKSDAIGKYLPLHWLDEYDDFPEGELVHLALFFRDADGRGMRLEGPVGVQAWDPAGWPGVSAKGRAGPLRFDLITGQAGTMGDRDGDGRALIFWYPEPQSVVVNPSRVLAWVERTGVGYLTQSIRHQVKLDSFGRLRCVTLITGSPDEYRKAVRVVEEGIKRFGGRATTFHPGGEGVSPMGPIP